MRVPPRGSTYPTHSTSSDIIALWCFLCSAINSISAPIFASPSIAAPRRPPPDKTGTTIKTPCARANFAITKCSVSAYNIVIIITYNRYIERERRDQNASPPEDREHNRGFFGLRGGKNAIKKLKTYNIITMTWTNKFVRTTTRTTIFSGSQLRGSLEENMMTSNVIIYCTFYAVTKRNVFIFAVSQSRLNGLTQAGGFDGAKKSVAWKLNYIKYCNVPMDNFTTSRVTLCVCVSNSNHSRVASRTIAPTIQFLYMGTLI